MSVHLRLEYRNRFYFVVVVFVVSFTAAAVIRIAFDTMQLIILAVRLEEGV